ELYRLARVFRNKVYALIAQLPPTEKYCLGPQMRRAAISISNNVAEGHGRWHFQENIQHCRISRGSVEEIIDDLNICVDQGYAGATAVQPLIDEAYQVIHRINGYIAYLRKSQQGGD